MFYKKRLKPCKRYVFLWMRKQSINYKTVELSKRYFVVNDVVNEWEYLLDHLGLTEDDIEDDTIEITVSDVEYEKAE